MLLVLAALVACVCAETFPAPFYRTLAVVAPSESSLARPLLFFISRTVLNGSDVVILQNLLAHNRHTRISLTGVRFCLILLDF